MRQINSVLLSIFAKYQIYGCEKYLKDMIKTDHKLVIFRSKEKYTFARIFWELCQRSVAYTEVFENDLPIQPVYADN